MILKLALVLAAELLTAGLVAWMSGRSPAWRRVWLAALVVSFALRPLATVDYQYGSRFNVRGWEFCWTDGIALGLLVAQLRLTPLPVRWLSPLIWLWLAHLAALGASAAAGIDPGTSAWYCWRMIRALLVMLTVAAALRERRDFEAVLAGLALTCLWNEWLVLRQKYGEGRHRAFGQFEHQNTMGMYMILCGTVLFAAWLFRAASARLRWPMFVAILCSAHGVFAGLSRGSMFFYASAMAATGATVMAIAPDRHKARALALMAVVAIAAGVALMPTIIARFNERGNQVSERSRDIMNHVADQMHRDRPLLGIGPNNYALAVNQARYAHIMDLLHRERGHRVDLETSRGQVESLYHGMRAEGGTLGYATLLAFIGASLLALAAKVVACRDPLARAFAIGAFWCLLANYLQCMLEHTLLHASNLYLWLTLVATGIALPWRRPIPGGATAVAAPPADRRPAARPAPGPAPAPAATPAPFWT